MRAVPLQSGCICVKKAYNGNKKGMEQRLHAFFIMLRAQAQRLMEKGVRGPQKAFALKRKTNPAVRGLSRKEIDRRTKERVDRRFKEDERKLRERKGRP